MANTIETKQEGAIGISGDSAPKELACQDRDENLLKMVLDATSSSVLLIDRHFRIVLCNRNFLEKSRRTEGDTIGRQLADVFPSVILREMDLEGRIRSIFKTDKPVRGERVRYWAPGVALRIYYYSILPVAWGGQTEDVMLVMDDVTEQVRLGEDVRRVERHLASIVESASDIVVSTDPKGLILSWNMAAEKATGYRFWEIKGRSVFDFFSARHMPEVRQAFRGLELLEGLTETQWDLATMQGQDVPVSWVCSTMKNDMGKIESVVAVGRNLTERRRLEAQILQSQKLAALGVMAGGIAHELRNPLAVSSSAAQFLSEENITPEFQKECAQKILTGIQRASVIIENMLRFARPVTPNSTELVDLASVIKDVVALISNEAALKKVEIGVEIAPTPLVIRGVPTMLQQLLMNLILNAFKAMPHGGKLAIAAGPAGDCAMIRVADNGCGIPRDALDKIFDPFYTTSPPGEGTGLGLSVCYSIVKQHGAVIEVESTEGSGTAFTVRFPLLREGAEGDEVHCGGGGRVAYGRFPRPK